MRKITLIAVMTALALLAFPINTNAQPGDPAILASEWLKTQQNENGSFADDLEATSLALIALGSVNDTNDLALEWLEANVSDELDLSQASLAVIALQANGIDSAEFADGDLLAIYSNLIRSARGESIDGMCLGLIARHNLGLPLPEPAIGMLVGLQSEEGGFGKALDVEPDLISTSFCTQVLVVAEQTESVDLALNYFRTHQLEDNAWALDTESVTSDPLATSFVLHALAAADQTLTEWGGPERTLFGFLDFEDGKFAFEDAEDSLANLITTSAAIPVFRGKSFISFTAEDSSQDSTTTNDGTDGPALNENWALVAGGFGMTELNTADDFFQTVIDPFTNDELYGIQIINWTAEYKYTGYIVENFLPAEVLLWLAEQDPTVWDNISVSTLSVLPPEVLEQLPEEVQAKLTAE